MNMAQHSSDLQASTPGYPSFEVNQIFHAAIVEKRQLRFDEELIEKKKLESEVRRLNAENALLKYSHIKTSEIEAVVFNSYGPHSWTKSLIKPNSSSFNFPDYAY